MLGYTNATGPISKFEIQPFSYYSEHFDELATVLQVHYDGEIDLSTLWSVGDTMTDISLGAISASSLGGDAQSAQNIDLVILDFNHDTLASDQTKKAVLTLGQKDSLSTLGSYYSSYTSYSYARYTNSVRRSWLNSDYYNALPSELKSLVKPVQKVTGYPTNTSNNQTTETTSETCWLASNWEIFGKNSSYTSVTDGTQYPYYATQSNRIKKQGKTGSANNLWWSRSGYWYSTGYASSSFAAFVLCDTGGSQGYDGASNSRGLAPCFCL